ncbi:hypothetical protein THIOKS11100025 [Thiocapsa sp. KS1]|nr:hypothetical protein THIOKS11100025 [Thiocapsa sp. KS1]
MNFMHPGEAGDVPSLSQVAALPRHWVQNLMDHEPKRCCGLARMRSSDRNPEWSLVLIYRRLVAHSETLDDE